MLNSQRPDVLVILSKAKDEIQLILGEPVEVDWKYSETTPENIRIARELKLKKIICDVCDVNWKEVESQSRKREIVYARHLFCSYAKTFLKLTLKDTGDRIGNRDHTTVINSLKVVQDLLETEEPLMVYYNSKINTLLYNETEAHS